MTYIYDEVEGDGDLSREEFIYIMESGIAKMRFTPGQMIRVKLEENPKAGPDTCMTFVLAGFNHYRKSDGAGFALTTWFAKDLLTFPYQMYHKLTRHVSWKDSAMRTWMNTEVAKLIPDWLQALIKTVDVRTHEQGNIVTTQDRFYIPCCAEVGIFTDLHPYRDEVDSEAETTTFSIFMDDTKRIKQNNATECADSWWLRSPSSGWSGYFVDVGTDGNDYLTWANCWLGVCGGFSI